MMGVGRNGRFNTMVHWITTTDPARLRTWERVLGMTQLPVTSARPLTRRLGRGKTEAVYLLDSATLLPIQRCRLAGYIARKCRVSYQDALETMWTIAAENCELVTEETRSPAFLLRMFARKHYWLGI